jgi:predicted short-subunit dehydrogenase-like oxidoreductase (DUF2520 family)
LASANRLGLARAVSGPVSRGDLAMVHRHLELAAGRASGDQLYRELLVRLVELAGSSQRLSAVQLTQLRAVLDSAESSQAS